MTWGVNKLMRAVNMWRDGKTIAQIAEHFGISPENVPVEDMKKYGLERVDVAE